jgi:hypothetical protein
VVEPARCFQTATATGADSIQLRAMTAISVTAPSGAVVPLIVVGAPNMPVTFTAFGSGTFRENDLNSVTVLGDAHGVATAHAVVPPIPAGRMTVQVGSPAAVGNQVFMIRVADPNREQL